MLNFRNASSSFGSSVLVFQRLLLLSVRQLRRDHMIYTIGLEEERGRAPHLIVEQGT